MFLAQEPRIMISRLHDYFHLLLAAIAILTMIAMLVLPAFAHDPAPAITGPADGWEFPLPAPGSYALPALGPAADARLRDESGRAHHLARLFAGRITVMAFVFTRCGDVCPLATMRLAELRELAAADPVLSARLQLLSVSFDPAYDTPARMADFASIWRDPDLAGADWRFLTPDAEGLERLLADYDQHVIRRTDPQGGAQTFSHILRVYLIDEGGAIRNVYSLDFLDPRLVLADIRTLAGTGAAGRETRNRR
jgi:cytochrome oxidase Cu insertion factor (SCO1/SenC/PrrC family)